MSKTKIEWCDSTINHVVGCSKGCSRGCDNCYAHKQFPRLKGMGTHLYKDMESFSDVSWDMNILKDKLKSKKKPERIFLCSMGDLFHEKVPTKIIDETLEICSRYPQHQFIILTKRYERMLYYLNEKNEPIKETPNNVYLGVSICNKKDLHDFMSIRDVCYWDYDFIISFEPLLERLIADDHLLDLIQHTSKWIIVGAESGNRKREFKEEWALEIKDLCEEHNIPFFFKKQFINGEETNLLDGKKYLEFPKELEIGE